MFQLRLRGRPVVVLSNNDGCVIARSNEAKALGIEMGAPWHLHKERFVRAGVVVRSSNYTLYGDMSARVMRVLADFTPDLEIYSIDEAFLCLNRIRATARGACTRLAGDRTAVDGHSWVGWHRAHQDGGPVAAEPKMHFRSTMLHKGLDPGNGVVPEARTDPNGTEKVSHANVPLG